MGSGWVILVTKAVDEMSQQIGNKNIVSNIWFKCFRG
jgi:hypothetical protein